MSYAVRAAFIIYGASLIGQLTILAVQLRTYRRTRHPSLTVISAATLLGLFYLGVNVFASLHGARAPMGWNSYLALEALFVTQVVLGVWGAAWLFRAFINFHVSSHAASPSATPAAAPAMPPEGVGFGTAVASVLGLWTLQRLVLVAGLASDRVVIACGAISLGVWAVLDRVHAGPHATFESFDIATVGLIILMLLVLAFVMARSSRPGLPYRQTLFIVVAILPLLIVLRTAGDAYVEGWWWLIAQAALLLYVLIYLWRSMITFSGARQLRTVLCCAVLLAGYAWVDHNLILDPSLWAHDEPEFAADPTWTAGISESLLFDQQRRIDTALSAVQPAKPSTPTVFFVGFAGVGSQKVFAEEIKLASQIIGRRFDTHDHQLLLVNDQRDRNAYPLATLSGLRYALDGVAHKMNLQEDVLFLSLSSHGSQQPQLSVSNGGLNLQQVSDKDLAQALRDAGFRWRVIVISACHAGAFIPALQNPRTIIITAAAAEKTSFGCSYDRDLTYFGEAFYRDALAQAPDLPEAFALAKAAIAKREAVEHITASEPEAYFGAEILEKLSQHLMSGAAPKRTALAGARLRLVQHFANDAAPGNEAPVAAVRAVVAIVAQHEEVVGGH